MCVYIKYTDRTMPCRMSSSWLEDLRPSFVYLFDITSYSIRMVMDHLESSIGPFKQASALPVREATPHFAHYDLLNSKKPIFCLPGRGPKGFEQHILGL